MFGEIQFSQRAFFEQCRLQLNRHLYSHAVSGRTWEEMKDADHQALMNYGHYRFHADLLEKATKREIANDNGYFIESALRKHIKALYTEHVEKFGFSMDTEFSDVADSDFEVRRAFAYFSGIRHYAIYQLPGLMAYATNRKVR